MAWVAVAIGGSALVGAYSANQASKAAANAANNSANAQLQATQDSLALQKEMYDKNVELQTPWMDAGLKALQNYASNPAFSFSYNDLTADPSYKFQQEQGVNALDMSAAARGKLLSGAQDKAVQQFGQNLASQEYGNAYNRALQTYNTNAQNQLNLAGMGQSATNALSGVGSNYASQAANTYQNQATGLSNAYTQAGQAQANMYSGIAQSANQGVGNNLLYQLYQQKKATPTVTTNNYYAGVE